MNRSQVPFVGFIVVGTVIIVSAIATCPDPAMCARRYLEPKGWADTLIGVVMPLAGGLAVLWAARLAFLLGRGMHRLSRLPRSEMPPTRLLASIARTGVRRVRCVAVRAPIAFCAGVLTPEIVVSEGLADRLGDDELDAVLLHEQHHLCEREPAMRAAAEAAAEVLFFVPIARWLARRRTEEAELRADRAAVQELGPRPVAAALCTLGSTRTAEAAAFAGVAELRVAQLLGDPIPVRRPGLRLVAASLFAVPFAVLAVTCIIQSVSRIAAG